MGVALLRSTSILPIFTLPWYSFASSSTMGAKARQGPHQAAQKSTKTGVSDFKTSWSKLVSVTSKIELLAIIPPVYVGPPRLLMLMAFLHQRISMNAPPDAGLTMLTPVLDA